MRKLRERLNNKKGFTLVELIVVIVIILILAAVLIPNVMRYIEQARKSTFQSEASGYLTEIQGFAAEAFATSDTGTDITGADLQGKLTANTEKLTGGVNVNASTLGAAAANTINVVIKAGAVTEFNYSDEKYTVSWSQATGWEDVDDLAS